MEKIIKGIFIILITFLVILQGTIISNADNTQSDEENAVTKISLKVKKSKKKKTENATKTSLFIILII